MKTKRESNQQYEENMTQAVKKGSKSWAPAHTTRVTDLDPNYAYRWVAKSADRVGKHLAEQWEFLSGVNPDSVKLESKARIYETESLTSTIEKHDAVLMRMPKKLADERNAYYAKRNVELSKAVGAIKEGAEAEAGSKFHGNIEIARQQQPVTTID